MSDLLRVIGPCTSAPVTQGSYLIEPDCTVKPLPCYRADDANTISVYIGPSDEVSDVRDLFGFAYALLRTRIAAQKRPTSISCVSVRVVRSTRLAAVPHIVRRSSTSRAAVYWESAPLAELVRIFGIPMSDVLHWASRSTQLMAVAEYLASATSGSGDHAEKTSSPGQSSAATFDETALYRIAERLHRQGQYFSFKWVLSNGAFLSEILGEP
jgi:hypothetical protein